MIEIVQEAKTLKTKLGRDYRLAPIGRCHCGEDHARVYQYTLRMTSYETDILLQTIQHLPALKSVTKRINALIEARRIARTT